MKSITECQAYPMLDTSAQDHLPRWIGFVVIVLASSGLWIMLTRAALGLH